MYITEELNTQRVEAFEEELVDTLNKGTLSLMISIGHRTGLFDILSEMDPATSQEIADTAGLQERYVREWLGAMSTGRIVELVGTNGKTQYYLPPEHAASLSRKSPADNIAVFAQYISVLGKVEDKIVSCFKNGGGVSYSDFDHFHEVMAEDSGQSVVSSLLDDILPLVPGLQEDLKKGIDVLDVGCGSGRALNLLAKTFSNSKFTGYDLCKEPLEKARADAKREGLSNVRFLRKDLTEFDVVGEYHLVTAFDAIHDQVRPDNVLAGIYNVLLPGGTFLMQDIAGSSEHSNNMDHPIAPMLYTISTMHCMSVSLGRGGMGLGTMWGEEKAIEMLEEAGFSDIRIEQLPHDFQNAYYIMQK